MCAMDRSQIMVYSQSGNQSIILRIAFNLIKSIFHVRDAQGELIYLSPPFDRTVLNGNEFKHDAVFI